MTKNPAQNYLLSKVLTATPEQLQLLLYDGAIRFADQARQCLADRNYEQSHVLLTKAQRILMELQCGLKKDIAPVLCGKLASLYNFVHRRLVDANVSQDIAAVDEALTILRYQRETWAMLLANLSKSKAAAAATTIDLPAPSPAMEASISFCG